MRKCRELSTITVMLLFLQHHINVVVSLPSAPSTHLSPNMQKLALFQLKLSLSTNTSAYACPGNDVLTMMNWSMSSDYCKWGGVTCDQMTRDVIELDLSCNQLVGVIRPNSTLFQLSLLQYIILDTNDLHGVLPEEIFHLPNLEGLSAIDTNLTVSFPKIKWGSSNRLQVLRLQYITLSGGIPNSIGYLQSLMELSLPECNIYGEIPKSMGNLTQLIKLDLSSNNLTGQIPNSLANLQNLVILFLNNNKLFGEFPSWVVNLRQLDQLILSNNSLTGPLPSNLPALSLPKLTNLQLFMNLLNGTLPYWLFDRPSLMFLSVDVNGFTGQLNEFHFPGLLQAFTCSNNLLNGSIPTSFFNLVNLNMLDLSSNNFSGVLDIEMFSHFENLYILSLSNNNISLKITSTTMLPPNINTLGLSSCKIKEFTHFLGTAENLQILDLSNNQIHGEIPKMTWLGTYSSLDFSRNFLTGGIEHLPWNNIRYLNLQYNMLNGSLPASICNSSRLDVLNLAHNNLSGVLPTCSTSLDYQLSVLDLQMNNIGGSLPSTLSNFRKLRSLNLYKNKVEGGIPLSFAEFDYLEVLDLGSNHMNGTFPHWLEALQNLQVLSLKLNKFHGIINSISKIERPFPRLRILDLSDNQFSGPLPEKYIRNFKGMMNGDVNKMERRYMGGFYYSDTITIVIKGVETQYVKILTILTTIDLSRNMFEGEIPEYIGDLKSLINLNFSHNHLTGHIPSSIGNLLMLESLDLCFNRLVGVIPQQLEGLNYLSRLNLSHNDLSGRIPQGPQLRTFENESYIGNLALCGHPLSKKCERETIETQEEDNEDDDYFFNGFTWEAMVIGYGSGLGLGFVIGYMMFKTREPKWIMEMIAKKLGVKVRRHEIRRFF